MQPFRSLPGFALAAGLVLAGAAGATAGPVMDRIAAEGLIRLGVRTDAPPFASVVGGKPAGFSVDLCSLVAGAIVDTSGVTQMDGKLVPVDTGDRFAALADGRIDVLCGATTATLSRRETVSFSIPTFSTGVGAAVAADAPDLLREVLVEGGPAALSRAAVTQALGGSTVGVRADTTAAEWLATGPLAGLEGIAVETVDDHAAGIAGVAEGRFSAYFADKAILLGVLRGMEPAPAITVSRMTFTAEPYALAIPRGDEDLRLVIDRALSFLYRNGTIYTLYQRHFGKPSAEVVLFYTVVALPE